MISWSNYDELRKILLTLRNTLYSIEDYPPNWADYTAIAKYQDSIVQFGNVLENMYGLKESGVVTVLEQHCEHLYHWMESKGTEKVLQWKLVKQDFANFLRELVPNCVGDTLACCVIVRNEAMYIKEWLDYHLLVGIKKFFIYDNESTDSLLEVLQPYIEKGIVCYQRWPGDNCQFSAYNDALVKYKEKVGYIAFIDADEFIVPQQERQLPDLVVELFAQELHAEAIGINWRVYGSSHFIEQPQGLVTENYVWRASDYNERNCLIKSIVNPRKAEGFFNNSHAVTLKEGNYCMSENGTVFGGAFFADGRCDKIRINHYYTKSKTEFVQKVVRGWPDQPHLPVLQEQIEYKFQKFDMESYAVEDRIMDRYLEKLKEIMNGG